MRYLNKIIFINSASVAYAEIELDGNVHLIGTQGVGKSTLLRAILFFYNANKVKLGIPREKKNYDDYYFPYQNSYVIYEVMKDGVPFCVLSYKVNGKVAFRFFDYGYEQQLFIDHQNRAFENWEQIRQAFGKSIYYTSIISSYDEFRRIIYGDNKSLKPEYRKYAIIESRQYENIPRTIQNVFLNSNLEAKFIKDTIINSLNEEEFTIDLENYSKNHLREFESQINDIAIWSKVNRKGEVPIRKQADSIIDHYRIHNYLNREKLELFRNLLLRMDYVEKQKPLLQVEISEEKQTKDRFYKEFEKLKDLHQKREQKIISEIDYFKKRIAEAQRKQQEYQRIEIDILISKVVEKESLQQESGALVEEKNLLTSKFVDIRTKYENLIRQIENEKQAYLNAKTSEINQLEQEFGNSKMELFTSYQNIVNDIKINSEAEKINAVEEIERLKNEKHSLDNQKSELKYQIFFESEIGAGKQNHEHLIAKISAGNSAIADSKHQIKNARKEWELETERIDARFEVETAKAKDQSAETENVIKEIESKIFQSEDSFYGWLNKNVSNWENTIGKVIDENVLFHSDLEPEQFEKETESLFGVRVNLEVLENKIKSVQEYRQDIERLKKQLEQIQKNSIRIEAEKETEQNKLKSGFTKKIKSLNDLIAKEEYQLNQNEEKQKINSVQLKEWVEKSESEKKIRATEIEKKLENSSYELSKATDQLTAVKKNISRRISLKETERDKKTADLEASKNEKVSTLQSSINTHKEQSDLRIEVLRKNQMDELEDKGADRKRLEEIDGKLSTIISSLEFIAQNEKTVIEYQKDKRELFDLLPQWKTDKITLENQQLHTGVTHKIELSKSHKKLSHQTEKLKSLEDKFSIFEIDISEFEKFKKSEAFAGMEAVLEDSSDKEEQDISKKASLLISEINDKYYKGIGKFQELQRSINGFVSNFNEANVFQFKVQFGNDEEYLNFALNLKEFIEEDKIQEYQKRVNERFGTIINQIGRETTELTSKEAEIEKTIKKINDDFLHKNFVEAIKEMEMRTQKSSNPIVSLLLEIKDFNEEHSLQLGQINLFSTSESSSKNHRAVELVKQLIKELERAKTSTLTLSESFDLQFRIVENDNDSGWVEKLSNVGSEGTDVLVKAMINILLLNVFKDSASRKIKDFKLHCMMDEIGRLHPNNVRGILKFANERNILLINGSPTSQNATDYKYTYKLAKEQSKSNPKRYLTKVNRLIKVTTKISN